MNPADFFLSLFKNHMKFDADQYALIRNDVANQWENSDNFIKKFFEKYPFVLVLLPVLLIVLTPLVDKLFKWMTGGDQDDDGELTIEDTIINLAEKLVRKKQEQTF